MPSANITKHAIAETMKTLMETQPLSKISVGDIASACGITRNSFYYHFKDKYDLVNWIFYTELVPVLSAKLPLGSPGWEAVDALCAFFYENKTFYRNALSVTGQNSFIEYFNEVLQSWIETRIAEVFPDSEEREFYISFFSDAFVITIAKWLRDGPKIPPEKFARLLKNAVVGAASWVVEQEENR